MQERFASHPMSENHLLDAAGYIELNPVRASLAKVEKRVEKRDDLKYLNKLSFEQGYFII